jgi:putative endopeptidase
LALFTIVGCKDEAKKDSAMADEKTPGIILENMDKTVSPKEDFYNYVNGNWAKTNTIPDDESRWGGFGVLRKSTRQDVLSILNTSKELGTYKEGSDQKKALLIFDSELDTLARNAAGIKPLQPLLDKINGIKNLNDMQTVFATTLGVGAPFAGIGANPDLNDSSMNTAWVFPGGLGLQRDYYLDTDEKTKEIRGKYVDHITRMLQYINYSEADARAAAEKILALETKLAEPRLDKVASRDIRNFNNPTALTDLQAMIPSIKWQKLRDDMGIEKKVDTLLVMQPKYMKVMDAFLKSTSIEDAKTLMTWNTLDNSAALLTTEMNKANWDFYSKT